MKINYAAAGAFVLLALILASATLFLIGDRHKAFSHHVDFYTEFQSVNGLTGGSKVRVAGLDAGEVANIQIPGRPSGKFRLKLHLDEKLHELIREDSVVTVESDGLVGDKFLMVHDGTDDSQKAAPGSTLQSKEPLELSAVLAKATGIMDQANLAVGDIRVKAGSALDAITTTVNNANGLVTNVKQGKGTVGMLLTDQKTADQVKAAVSNTQQATVNLNQVTVQAKQIMSDFQSRDLFQKAEDTLNNAKDASRQIDQTTQQLNSTLNDALGADRSGATAGANLRETLSNVNLATANMAEDTEALKHGFLFRGYFKKRGFYSLADLTPESYRTNAYFQNAGNQRTWLSGTDLFVQDADGRDFLSPSGERAIDQVIGAAKDRVINQPLVIEGYSDAALSSEQMAASRARAILVAQYVERRYHLSPKNVATMPLNGTAPAASGKSSWDGVCLVLLQAAK